jgi:hypothetical protein
LESESEFLVQKEVQISFGLKVNFGSKGSSKSEFSFYASFEEVPNSPTYRKPKFSKCINKFKSEISELSSKGNLINEK